MEQLIASCELREEITGSNAAQAILDLLITQLIWGSQNLCFIHSTKILFGPEIDIGLKPSLPNRDLILCHLWHLGNIYHTF